MGNQNSNEFAVQFSGVADSAPRIQLVMGLDFGTAFTKVVIAESRQAWAIPWGGAKHDENPYLFPCVLRFLEDGAGAIGEGGGSAAIRELKMRILKGGTDDALIIETVVYLALVMREARAWFMARNHDVYGGYALDWNINVGLPTERFEDPELQSFYRQIVQAAWLASTVEGNITRAVAEASYLDDARWISEDMIGLFPEFVAQITGYVRSPLRRSDLHFLVDVGAGTVDASFFNVFENEDGDMFPIFSSSVQHRGVHFLYEHRSRYFSEVNTTPPGWMEQHWTDKEMAEALGTTLEVLHGVDGPFRGRVLEQFREDRLDAHNKYPLSRRWSEGVSFFLCGGGSKVRFYAELGETMSEQDVPCPLVRMDIPKPGRLMAPGLVSQEYDRLSVAYGLSFDQFDIGVVQPSSEIEDLVEYGKDWNATPAVRSAVQVLCALCGGTGGWRGNDCKHCGGSGLA